MRYALLDEDGHIETAINDETITKLPIGAVALTDEQWENRFNLRLVDGDWIVDPVIPQESQE